MPQRPPRYGCAHDGAGRRVTEWLEALAGIAAAQLARTFLWPGSHFCVAALAVSLATFAVLVARRRARGVRARLLARLLLPRRLLGSASGRTDAAFALAAVTLTSAAIGWAVIAAGEVRAALAPLLGPAATPWLPAWAAATLATVILFLAYEFAYWLDHWLMHKVPVLWPFHAVHHRAESLSLLTNFRVHPVETILFFNLAALVLGAAQALLLRALGPAALPLTAGGTNLLVLAAAALVTNLQHSHLWVGFGPRWGRWLLGPAHHQVHHSRAERHYGRNMGNLLTIYDRLFGTFWMPAAAREVPQFGVADGLAHPHGWRASLLEPFAEAARIALRACRRHRRPLPAAG